jgi:predicted MFS family arabinose efflux permease
VTFVLGPALLAWLGTDQRLALWVVLGLVLAAWVTSLWIPHLPLPPNGDKPSAGPRGLWHALRAHPVVMVVGLVGGFFESGMSSLLPLYGLAIGLTPAMAALLVSASGLGSSLMMLPAGLLADAMVRHPQQRWGNTPQARRTLMRACTLITLLATLLVPWVAPHPALAWPLVFIWGGAGGCLYTLAMVDIGDRETGLALVNSTSVLVMSYTLGGLLAPALGGMALQWSATLGFPALLLAAAVLGMAALQAQRFRW